MIEQSTSGVKRPLPTLSRLEQMILTACARPKYPTASEILVELMSEKPQIGFQVIQNKLSQLINKGYLTVDQTGRLKRYRPLIDTKAVAKIPGR